MFPARVTLEPWNGAAAVVKKSVAPWGHTYGGKKKLALIKQSGDYVLCLCVAQVCETPKRGVAKIVRGDFDYIVFL